MQSSDLARRQPNYPMGDAIGRAAQRIPEFFLVNECLRQHTSSSTPTRLSLLRERRCGHAVMAGWRIGA
jgi:hypothetical protein